MNPIFFIAVLFLFASCAVIQPGEIGFRIKLGRIKGPVVPSGTIGYNIFVTRVHKMPIRTVEVINTLDLPTSEGLSVKGEVMLLYHIKPDMAQQVFTNYGSNYQEVMVLSNFRSIARNVCARYTAKEIYAIDRHKAEIAIFEQLTKDIGEKGFVIDAVLLKSIVLPEQLFQAIEDRLKAEQQALQMDFVIQKQRKESERMKIEAEGLRDYQKIVGEGVSEIMLRWNSLQIMRELVKSNNAKIIITDGKTPMIVNPDK